MRSLISCNPLAPWQIVLLLIWPLFAPALCAQPTVAFINPDTPQNPFWSSVTEMMEAAAEDLGIELKVYFANQDRRHGLELALQILDAEQPPDYLLFIHQKGQFLRQMGHQILTKAEARGVFTFTFNTEVPAEVRLEVGAPGDRYSSWIGQLLPDDKSVGMRLAAKLAEVGTSRFTPPIRMVGFTGTRDSSAATQRNSGLKQALSSQNQIDFKQLVYSDWDRNVVEQQLPFLLRRYPGVRLIWAASDSMALGAASALKSLGHKPGLDYLIGGIDWTVEAIDAVVRGELLVTYGGHFLEGAWSLILLHDHYHGLVEPEEMRRIETEWIAIDGDNVHRYKKILAERPWPEMDFRQFSRRYGFTGPVSTFSPHVVINRIERSEHRLDKPPANQKGQQP